MADYDAETGAVMPLLTHDGLAKHVREEVASWSSDKREEYALTRGHAVHAALLDIWTDGR